MHGSYFKCAMFMPRQPSFVHRTGFACVPHCSVGTEKVRQTLLLHDPLWEPPGVGVGCETEVRPGGNGEQCYYGRFVLWRSELDRDCV